MIDGLPDRITSKIWPEPMSGCWLWSGYDVSGYGRTRFGARCNRVLVHRLIFETVVGPIPEGMCVCHRCDNPSCCNPDHLFLGTLSDNTQDMLAKGRGGHKSGERNPTSVLTDAEVRMIRRMVSAGESQAEVARRFCVTQSSVSRIAIGDHRKDAGGPITRRQKQRKKLTAAQVRCVCERLRGGDLQRVIAKDFGVSQGAISRIATGKTRVELELTGESNGTDSE